MKKILCALFCLTCIYSIGTLAWGGEKYKSLRGEDVPAPSNPPVSMDWKAEESAVPRTFVHQPPLIPHTVDEYEVTTTKNDCLECHEDKDSGAPMPHASHYLDRNDKKGEKVSARWYFCTQCHIGQVEAKPLVENTFQAK